eukprot:292010-Chlamydomonas_euryale.AAC.1
MLRDRRTRVDVVTAIAALAPACRGAVPPVGSWRRCYPLQPRRRRRQRSAAAAVRGWRHIHPHPRRCPSSV